VKRVLLSVVGTVLGLVALLSFKSHSPTLTAAGGLAVPRPAAGSSSAAATPTSAPPNPASSAASAGAASGSAAASPAAKPANRSVDGQAVQTRYGTVQLRLTLAGSKITNVAFLQLTSSDGRSADINSQAAPILVQETLQAQSAQIDLVSGATYTSDGYLQSLQSALDAAGRQ
jgi:uncharacterized protein with FMN-binding domain